MQCPHQGATDNYFSKLSSMLLPLPLLLLLPLPLLLLLLLLLLLHIHAIATNPLLALLDVSHTASCSPILGVRTG
jgi:hypothetical protein